MKYDIIWFQEKKNIYVAIDWGFSNPSEKNGHTWRKQVENIIGRASLLEN